MKARRFKVLLRSSCLALLVASLRTLRRPPSHMAGRAMAVTEGLRCKVAKVVAYRA